MRFPITSLSIITMLLLAPGADATVLQGSVQYHDVEGRIGARVSHWGKILKVHPESPASNAGLKEGDQVVLVDGKPGNVDNIHGQPFTTVNLKVKRSQQELSFKIMRVNYTDIQH